MLMKWRGLEGEKSNYSCFWDKGILGIQNHWSIIGILIKRGVLGVWRGIEVVCGEVQSLKSAVGMTPGEFIIKPIYCRLEFSTVPICLWPDGGKNGKEKKFQSSQTPWLN